MKKIILAIMISVGLTISANAQVTDEAKNSAKPMSTHKIKKMDNKLTKHNAVKRNFKTKQEFQYRNKHHMAQKRNRHFSSRNSQYKNSYESNNRGYTQEYRHIRQRGYRNSKRGWILAYRYDRASFYDNEGFYYGYFNRYGYYFEDIFYRYDREYNYEDRIRGRGLFSYRYYMPTNHRYYGFCRSRHSPRDYRR